jgi:hypothetical protein
MTDGIDIAAKIITIFPVGILIADMIYLVVQKSRLKKFVYLALAAHLSGAISFALHFAGQFYVDDTASKIQYAFLLVACIFLQVLVLWSFEILKVFAVLFQKKQMKLLDTVQKCYFTLTTLLYIPAIFIENVFSV